MEQERTASAGLRRRRRGVALLLASTLALLPVPTLAAGPATPTDARGWFESGAEAYARERYDEASTAFAKSYAMDPNTDVLFAWAQSERLAGNCEEANRLYDRFLDTDPSKQQREAALLLKSECTPAAPPKTEAQGEGEAVEDAESDDTEVGLVGPVEPPSGDDPTAGSGSTDDPRDAKDKSGLILIGVGAGVAVVGGALLATGAGLDARARNAETYEDLQRYRDPDTGRGKGAVPAYAAGGVLAAAGVGVLIVGVVRNKRGRSRNAALPEAAPAFARGYAGLSLQWRR